METSCQTNKIIDKPLEIGAKDLYRAVPYTYRGYLDLFSAEFHRKKWKPRYCIISQGCLYMYADKTSKKIKHSYSLKDFESAQACEPQEGEIFCIKLIFKDTKTPLLFACDSDKQREELVEHFCSTIELVKSQTNLSADSGFGSAGTVPKHIERPGLQEEQAYEYAIDRFPEAISHHKNITEENTRFSGKSYTSDNSIYYENENAPTIFTESKRKQMHAKTKGKGIQVSSGKETDKDTPQLKVLKGSSHENNTQPMGIPLPHVVMDELKSKFEENCVLRVNEKTSIAATSGASYLSVRGGAMSYISEDTTKLAGQDQEAMYVNRESCGSSPEIVYENTEPKTFQKKEYLCSEKKQMKKELVRLREGTFAVCPGDSTELELLVQTEAGLKCFRIYSQNGKVSLFQSHQYSRFPSLDDLLSYYVVNPLPSSNYSVKLVRGYRSQ